MFNKYYNKLNKMKDMEFERNLELASATLKPIALNLTKDPEETKDLLQLTLMKAWLNKHRFKSGSNINAWLYTIMKNTFLSDNRKKKKTRAHIDISSSQFAINSSTMITRLPGTDSELNMNEIYSMINDLPLQYEEPFKLYLKGYKYDEISLSLCLPIGTVKSRIFLARQKLKTQLNL